MFRIPPSVTHKLEGMISRFFWGNSTTKGIYWQDKGILQLPKARGSLGIHKIDLFNTALLMKQVRRMQENPQLLISKVFKDTKHQKIRLHVRRHNTSLGNE